MTKELKKHSIFPIGLQEENADVIFVEEMKWNMKSGIYCSQKTILEAPQFLITWLRFSSHNGNGKQAIQPGLGKGKNLLRGY